MAKKYEFKMPDSTYKPSTYTDNTGAYANDIARARLALEQAQASKPGAYQSQYADQVSNVIGRIQGRKFNYDVNQDAMFQQLKSIYDAQGRAAMSDAMGQAAAMTGGYGNSYAAAVGNQARQAANEQLYNRIPELYQLALARYQLEGNDLQNEYAILSGEDATAYGRHRDTVTDWQNERAYQDAALRNYQSMNQGLWSQDESNAYNANNQAWESYRWGEQMNENARQFDAQMAENQRQFDQQMAARSYGGGSGGYSGGGDYSTGDTANNRDSVNTDSITAKMTGANRYSDNGTLFTDKEYKTWKNNLDRSSTDESIIVSIHDALTEGKITEAQADAELARRGLTQKAITYISRINSKYNNGAAAKPLSVNNKPKKASTK